MANDVLVMMEMFREIILHWARSLDLFIGTLSAMAVVLMKASPSFGRPWESRTSARDFERELTARRAYNEWQGRMPVAR